MAQAFIGYLIMVDEQFSQLQETSAYYLHALLSYLIFPNNKRLNVGKGLDGLDIMILKLGFREINLFRMSINKQIFDYNLSKSKVFMAPVVLD